MSELVISLPDVMITLGVDIFLIGGTNFGRSLKQSQVYQQIYLHWKSKVISFGRYFSGDRT